MAYLTAPEHQKLLPPYIPYGPTQQGGRGGGRPGGDARRAHRPREPVRHGLFYGRDFWVDNVEKLNERFNSWAAQ